MEPDPTRVRIRFWLFVLAFVLVGAGLIAWFAAPGWMRNPSGAILYEVFWIVAVQAVALRWRPSRISAGVLLATSAVELLQLWAHPWLVFARSTLPGRLLLGANGGFDPSDFVWYVLGSALGYGVVRAVLARVGRAPTAVAPAGSRGPTNVTDRYRW